MITTSRSSKVYCSWSKVTGRKKRRSHQSRSGNSSSKPSSVSSQRELVVFQFDEETVPSGEWEGHMVDFVVDTATKLPNASKLPDHVVPPAYDDWAVDVFDWQTQCAMKATGEGDVVVYKDMKFIPVAGCEVDASVIHEQFEGEMKNVLHFNPGCGDFNASDDETVTHVLTRKGSTQKDGYVDSEPHVRVRIMQQRTEAKRNEVKVWREAYYEKYTNGASLVASCGGTKNTMKYGEYPRSEVKFSEMDGVPKDAITQYNGLDIWTFTDGVTFSCGWLTPAGEHIVSERIMDGSATVSAKITRKTVVP
ncbi:unnamed protein product [Bathycoccus prasinos]